MKTCLSLLLFVAILIPTTAFSQTDTVNVLDFFATGGTEGTLNTAVTAKITAGTLSNTVFKLSPYGLYVLSSRITVPPGQRLTVVADKPGSTQETAPPMLCWTPSSGINTTYNFDCFGDIVLKNIWILYATTDNVGVGTQVGSALEIEEDTTDFVNNGTFDNVIFDYAPISNGGGSVTVTASHARLNFTNCYFRNNTDTHFRYYGRAVSFPFGTAGWHIDSLTFENTTFANMGYVYMQEGAEYADYIKFNHCTIINTMMFTLESGWWNWLSVTNCVFVNTYMFGDVASNTNPFGGTIRIDSISTFGFSVPFTESNRHILFANNSYSMDPWLKTYLGHNAYSDTVSAANKPVQQPMLSPSTVAMFNDDAGHPYLSLKNNYDSTDPGFLIPPTNQIGIKSFLLRKWTDNSDTTWAFNPNADINQAWPMDEQLRYSNTKLKTGAMGGFPVGDLYRWWNNLPANYTNWKAQAATENQTINTWLTNGVTGIEEELAEVPVGYELSQNFPNPFNPATQIAYTLPTRSDVTLKVFNLLGMEVATLSAGVEEAGRHAVTFDASGLSSGVYFYRLQSGAQMLMRKMLLLK